MGNRERRRLLKQASRNAARRAQGKARQGGRGMRFGFREFRDVYALMGLCSKIVGKCCFC